jgi:hypothetical protein
VFSWNPNRKILIRAVFVELEGDLSREDPRHERVQGSLVFDTPDLDHVTKSMTSTSSTEGWNHVDAAYVYSVTPAYDREVDKQLEVYPFRPGWKNWFICIAVSCRIHVKKDQSSLDQDDYITLGTPQTGRV